MFRETYHRVLCSQSLWRWHEVTVEVVFTGQKVQHPSRRRRCHWMEVRKHRWVRDTKVKVIVFLTNADKMTTTCGPGCFRCKRIYFLPQCGRRLFHGRSGQVGTLTHVTWNFSPPGNQPVTLSCSPSELLVDEECLLQLFQSCRRCNSQCDVSRTVQGIKVTVSHSCRCCGSSHQWSNLWGADANSLVGRWRSSSSRTVMVVHTSISGPPRGSRGAEDHFLLLLCVCARAHARTCACKFLYS